ncbi:hypothetical protein MRX96_029290 [Rhipicephalus microplus]
MAFMMPVVRNDYDIYNRSRRSSPDHSNIGSPLGSTSLSTSPNVHGSGEDVRKMYRTHEHLDTLGPHRPRSGFTDVTQEVSPPTGGYAEARRTSQQPRPYGDGSIELRFWLFLKRGG